MPLKNTPKQFGSLTKLFHWSIFILFTTQFYLIYSRWWLIPEDSPKSLDYILLHKSLGVLLVAIGLGFLIVRRLGQRPPDVSQSKKERIAAKATHHSLLLLIVLMPVSGMLMSMFGQWGLKFFGIDLPVFEHNPTLSKFFRDAHEWISFAVIGLVSIHVLASLFHHFIRKDNVLNRMRPFGIKD